MGQLSNKGEELALAALFNDATKPVYVGLSTTALVDTNTTFHASEPTDASYSRLQVTFGTPTQVNGVTTTSNNNKIDYPAWTADATAKITYAFLTYSQTGTGDIITWFDLALADQHQPVAGQPLSIPAGGLTITLE